MNQTRLEAFMVKYRTALCHAVTTHPAEYGYGLDRVGEVAVRMQDAIVAGTYNKDSHAFKAVCRELKIPHTYTAIRVWLEQV